MNFGYVRVSSIDQNPERQLVEMRKQDILDSNIYLDRQSGKDFNRENWKKLARKLTVGDVLFIKSIDRLGRNYNDILSVWRRLREKSVDIVVLDMPLLDTRSDKDLMGTVISDIVLQLLSYVAQTEREFIKQRQAEGIAAAKERGVVFGRRTKFDAERFEKARLEYAAGECTAREAGEYCGVTNNAFLKWVRTYNSGNLEKLERLDQKRRAQSA